ncbi:putative zinc-binding protein [Desulfolutivibrio sulfoxidireducens]|uniref:putative zinc-binding protein n=1 Tax=Desulfolutivibrio sulfoxidireducens TaxID=2773299 RepID=UPI00159E33A8|nr:putative zinc-binding protein [Desulfolutivibrio sulfoxidireducens]QLA15381.1 zinc-binding protein [Desulfolutivibrio sulfoxidireducens]
MAGEKSCACSTAPKLIFFCSGGADVGAVADRAAQKLTRDGVGKMFCLAGIGGRVSGIVKSTEAACKILAIDGCTLDCAAKTLKEAGFADFVHVRLTDLGCEKGNTPVDDDRVAAVAQQITPLFSE